MITWNPLISWSLFFILIIGMGITAFLPLYFQFRNGLKVGRVILKAFFLLGFLLSLSWVLLRPQQSLQVNEELEIVYQPELEKDIIDFWKDSLGIKKSRSIQEYVAGPERVILLGDSFERKDLNALRGKDFSWKIPEDKIKVRSLKWKGYVRKGEFQQVSYSVFSPNPETSLVLMGAVNDSIQLNQGWNQGQFEFPVIGQGRSEFPLVLDQDTLASLRFFVGPSVSKKYHFQVGFPGTEVRTLSNWLRSKGEVVSEQIQVSRSTVLNSGSFTDSLHIQFVDPAQLSKKSVQDWVKASHGSLVILNVNNPGVVVSEVNRIFGTDFQIERTSQEDFRTLNSGIEAMPFQWIEVEGQSLIYENSIATQQVAGNSISISLINSTFPLMLRGNQEEYETIWSTLLGKLEPEEPQSILLNAPALDGISQSIQFFDRDSLLQVWVGGNDTVYLKKNVINPYMAEGEFQPTQSGWIDDEEGFSFYSYTKDELLLVVTHRLISHIQNSNSEIDPKSRTFQKVISPWYGIVALLLFLGLTWLEPKVR